MERMSFQETPEGLYQGLYQMGSYLDNSGLDKRFLYVLDYYVSMLNKCAFCLDMHFKEAIEAGESTVRMSMLPAWRDTHVFSSAECAVLCYAESLTVVSDNVSDDEIYSAMQAHYTQDQIAAWTLAIVRINGWNRFMKAFRTKSGEYQIGQFA